MTKNLKKIHSSNPLLNIGRIDDLQTYNRINSDEELAAFYHYLLDVAERENNMLLEKFTHAMITHATSISFNPEMLIQ